MSYNVLYPVSLIKDGDMSGDITSIPLEIRLQDNIGFQLIWTGTPVGTFDVQISADKIIWNSIPLATIISANGTADTAYIDLMQLSAFYIRLVYNRTSGTGILNAQGLGKGV